MNFVDTLIKYAGFGVAGGISLAAYDFALDLVGMDLSSNLPTWMRPYVTSSGNYTQSFVKGAVAGMVIPWVAEPLGVASIRPGRLVLQAQRIV